MPRGPLLYSMIRNSCLFAAAGQGSSRCLLLLLGKTRRIYLFRDAGITCSNLWNKNSREKTQQTYHNCKDPGSLFQHIGRLFHTHQLVAEAAYISCQSTPLGVLNQDDHSKNYTGKNNQDHKENHINEYLIVRFWPQNTPFSRD